MMRWWWVGDHGAAKPRSMERAATVVEAFAISSFQNVALVVGSTGIVGAALLDILPSPYVPGGPWKVYALSRCPLPSWSPPLGAPSSEANANHHIVHLHLDLADLAEVDEALKPLTDITHVFYVARSPCRGATEEEARAANCAMLQNVLTAVVTHCPALTHVCVQTGRKQFVDPFETLTTMAYAFVRVRPYAEDLLRLEDVLLNVLVDSPITRSVHRPSTVFGFSPRSARNVISSLCVYAAICSKEGKVLRWPGSRVAWDGFSDASDAQLVAEHLLWAALERHGKNGAYNCTNGDVYKWKNLWPMLAAHFEVEWSEYDGEDKRFKLEDAMAGKEAVWAEIIKEKGLVETDLNDITTWWFVDALINADKEHLENMNKSKAHGFYGFSNTVTSFNKLITKMKVDRIIP